MATGQRVEQLRLEREWTQQQLADKVTRAGYKISQSAVDKMEKRDAERPRCVRELAIVFGVTEEWLLTGRGQKESPRHKGLLPIDEDYDEEIERDVQSYRAFRYAEKRDRRGVKT